jgi:hypothetical protein
MREPFAAAELAVEAVVVDQRAAPAAPRDVAASEHLHDLEEGLLLQIAVRVAALEKGEQRVLVPLLFRRRFRHDLLGEHVERLVGHRDAVELALAHGLDHGRALDEIVAREREDPALRHAMMVCPGAADALQEGGDAVRRGDLAHEVDVADVDAELERGGGHQHLSCRSRSRCSASRRTSFARLPW